jgi:hypothetical protein
MSLSQLPAYPNPSVERPEQAAGRRDWGLLLRRLILLTVVGGFIALLAFVLALVVTAGQILLLFERLRELG